MKKRMFTPDFFTDEELVEGLDIPGRLFYLGTWSVAEDSGVIPMSPLSLKMKVFPGDDVSPEKLQEYIDILVSMKKIIPFEHGGKKYGWVKNFHRHQTLDNPSKPTLPLPHWVTWMEGETRKKSRYFVDESLLEQHILIACPGRVPDKTGTCPAELKELKEGKEVAEVIKQDGQVRDNTLPSLENESELKLDDYCQEIELQMTACGANPNYVVQGEALDWAKKFHSSNVPISFIRSSIVQAYARKKEISTFTYIAKIIKDDWARELQKREPVEPLSFHVELSKSRDGPKIDREFLEQYRMED